MSHYIKISNAGKRLPVEATDHAAVLDMTTRLMWAATDLHDDDQTYFEADAAASSLNLAGFSDWRLPDDVELLSIVDRSRYSPAIDTDFFPSTKSDWYWTSKETAWSSAFVWLVHFGVGRVIYAHSYYGALARAVRWASREEIAKIIGVNQ